MAKGKSTFVRNFECVDEICQAIAVSLTDYGL